MGLRNHIGVVLDCSGSMDAIRRITIEKYNSLVETIKAKAAMTGQETTVTLMLFDTLPRLQFSGSDLQQIKPLTMELYRPDGMTALFDAVGQTAEALARLPHAGDKDTSFLIMTLTDGEENRSRQDPTGSGLKKLIFDKTGDGRWSFVFQVPPGGRGVLAGQFGLPTDNIREWKATEEGVKDAATADTQGINNYFTARKKGIRAVTTFYVDTDMADVKPEDIKARLVDQAGRYKCYVVQKEYAIKDFVESKTKKPYVIGSGYYLLMKPEEVQETKSVLIMEKGQKAIWGGKEARQLIGLPDNAKARVKPGNHANYDIYVQSTSVNRKLPRGTKCIIDMQQTANMAPTWDHTQLQQPPASASAQQPTTTSK